MELFFPDYFSNTLPEIMEISSPRYLLAVYRITLTLKRNYFYTMEMSKPMAVGLSRILLQYFQNISICCGRVQFFQ